jgi:hypothetical protein
LAGHWRVERPSSARQLLEEARGWVSEGHGTLDQARALELASELEQS